MAVRSRITWDHPQLTLHQGEIIGDREAIAYHDVVKRVSQQIGGAETPADRSDHSSENTTPNK